MHGQNVILQILKGFSTDGARTREGDVLVVRFEMLLRRKLAPRNGETTLFGARKTQVWTGDSMLHVEMFGATYVESVFLVMFLSRAWSGLVAVVVAIVVVVVFRLRILVSGRNEAALRALELVVDDARIEYRIASFERLQSGRCLGDISVVSLHMVLHVIFADQFGAFFAGQARLGPSLALFQAWFFSSIIFWFPLPPFFDGV